MPIEVYNDRRQKLNKLTKKQKILIIILFCASPFVLELIVRANFAFFYVFFFSICPLSTIADLGEFYFGDKEKDHFIIEGKKERINRAYLFPLIGLLFVFGFFKYREIYGNENFTVSQVKLIDYTIGIGAIILLISQLAHLFISLSSKFLNFKFTTYLLLFFLSYITCGLSFAALYYLNIDGMKIGNSDDKIFDLVYFSFTTLSTTGFGDILPGSVSTKTFAIVENMVGLFLTGYLITMIFTSSRKGK